MNNKILFKTGILYSICLIIVCLCVGVCIIDFLCAKALTNNYKYSANFYQVLPTNLYELSESRFVLGDKTPNRNMQVRNVSEKDPPPTVTCTTLRSNAIFERVM